MAAIGRSGTPAPLGKFVFDVSRAGVLPSADDAAPGINAQVAKAYAASVAGKSNGAYPLASVKIPAGTYTLKSPLYIPGNYVRLVGEGKGTTILQGAQNSGSPIVCFGISDQGFPSANPLGSAYRPDGYNVLDSSAAPTAGVRWGFSGSTKGDGALVAFATPLSHGPRIEGDGIPTGWREVPKVTVDFLLVGPSGGSMPANQSVWGMGSPQEKAFPFRLDTTDINTYRLTVTTQSGLFGPTSNYQATFSTGSGTTGPQRITVQVDLVAGKVTAYAQGAQLAVSGTMPPAGSAFNENLYFPFSVNADNYNGHGIGTSAASGTWSLYGLNISTGLRYADRGSGQAQIAHPQVVWPYSGAQSSFAIAEPGAATGGTYTLTIGGQTATITAGCTAAAMTTALTGIGLAVSSVSGPTISGSGNVRCYQVALSSGTVTASEGMCDGSALTGQQLDDVYRYFPLSGYFPNMIDYYSVGYFAFTEDPANGPRMLAIQGGWHGAGQAIGAAIGVNPGAFGQAATGVGLEGITVRGGQFSPYGVGIMCGPVLDVDLVDWEASGGTFGLADLPFGANYTTTGRRGAVGGNTAGAFHYWGNAVYGGLGIDTMGKAFVLSVGSDIVTRDVFISHESGSPYAAFLHLASEYGGKYIHENTTCDFEGATSLGLGLFAVEAASTASTTLRITDVYGGVIGDSPVIRLRAGAGVGPAGPAHLQASNLNVSTTGATVDADGLPWHGVVEGAAAAGPSQNSNTAVVSNGKGGPAAIQVPDRFVRTPPRHGRHPWSVGTAPVIVGGAPDGLFERYTLTGAGTHGTATPPRWTGRDPVQSSPSALGALAIGHTAISATLSGVSASQGFLCDKAAIMLAMALFRGQALGAPATLYFGFYPRPSTVADTWDPNQEIPTSTGYARAAMANTSATFAASSAGSKANAAAITWPAATTSYTVRSIGCFASGTDTTPLFAINLASPLVVAVGQAPSIASGALVFSNAPAGDVLGGLTDFGFARCLDALFGGAALGAPAAWSPALTTATPSRTTTAPTEPGNGYARPSIATGSNWSVGRGWSLVAADDSTHRAGEVRATSSIGYGTATAAWPGLAGVVLMDAQAGGNPWAFGPLAVPCAPASGSSPAFAAGAFVASPR